MPVSVGDIRLHDCLKDEATRYHFHPALFDACLQVGNGAVFHLSHLGYSARTGARTYLPVRMTRVRWFRQPPRRVLTRAEIRTFNELTLQFDYRVTDAKGNTILEVENSTSRALGKSNTVNRLAGAQQGYYHEV